MTKILKIMHKENQTFMKHLKKLISLEMITTQ